MKKGSIMSVSPKAPLVASKALPVSIDDAHAALTEKLRQRAQGGGKRAARRAQMAAFGKGGEVALPRPKTDLATPRESMSRMSYGARKKQPGGFIARHKAGIKDLGTVTVSATKKSTTPYRVMSIADYFASVMKADDPTPPPASGDPIRFPRKEKPTIKMKPIGTTTHQRTGATVQMHAIGDAEAMANMKAGKHLKGGYEKSILVKLAAIKALVTGYNKVSGGGALRAANRRNAPLTDFNRAMETMPKPSGSLPPPTTYLPGVHGPEVKARAAKIRAKASKRTAKAIGKAECGCVDSSMEEPTLKKQKNVVNKSEGAAPMAKTNFNDLFKSELGVAADETLVDCPHCEAPITKSDIARANASGKTMHGGTGTGQVTSSRGVPGAKKTDEVVGVQNGKGSKARKSDFESSEDDIDKGDAPVGEQQVEAPKQMQKSVSVRGSDFVQYVNYGDAPGGDAYIAKSIAEAQGALGQQATQPMDLNNDLSRLLV